MPDDCLFYHTIDLPDGFHAGAWDCRDVVDAYLGNVDFAGKTVLEIGPANGFFTFAMESRGASVTCLDLGKDGNWDLVPGPLIERKKVAEASRLTIQRIENSFWHGHRLLNSHAQMAYGSIYDSPKLVKSAQIGILGNILQHLRDPVGGMMAAAECVTDTLIVTETMWLDDPIMETHPVMHLIPRADIPAVIQSWWQLSFPLVGEVLKMLGFAELRAHFHYPTLNENGVSRPVRHMTWVGRRPR